MDFSTKNYNAFVFQLDQNELINYTEFIFVNRNYIINNLKLYYKYKELLNKDILIKTNAFKSLEKNPETYLYGHFINLKIIGST